MNKMRSLITALLCGVASSALAANGTITTKDAGSVTRTFDVLTFNAGADFAAVTMICDNTTEYQCANVGTAGSPSTNALTVQPVTLGNGTSANAARVTISNDSTGQVTLAAGSAAIGTVTLGAGAAAIGTVTLASGSTVRIVGNAGAILDGATGAAVPANVVYLGVNNGGNLLGWPAKTASSAVPADVVPEVAVANSNANGQATMANSAPVAIASNQSSLSINSFSAAPTATVTRAANTTQYTANTGWCNLTAACATVFSFTSACRANGTMVLIPEIDIWSSANPATKLQGIIWLFSTAPGTVINDNATFNIAAADFANLTGNQNGFPFTLASAQASGAANSGVSLTGTTYHAQCPGGSTTLTAMVQVVNTYTPANGEVLHITLHTVGVN